MAFAQSQEDEDKDFLTRLIEDNLSGDTRTVNIVGFEGALSSEATIERLTVADSEGVWLSLEDVTLDWNRSALLRGAIDVQELSAAKVVVTRAPVPDTSIDLPDAEATPFALPDLPVSITLDELRLDEIALGDSFLGEPINVSLTGNANLSGGAGAATVKAIRLDERSGTFIIDGSYDNVSQVLALDLDLSEGPDGIIARLIDLPDKPSIDLKLQGEDPITDYSATLQLATDNVERIAGAIAVRDTDAGQAFGLDIGGDVTSLFAQEYQSFFGPDVTLKAAGAAVEGGGFALSDLTLDGQNITLNGEIVTDADGWPSRIDLTGEVIDETGEIVLLPLAGTQTFVQRVGLDIDYDRQASDDWRASFQIAGLERPGLLIDTIDLQGGGTLLGGDSPALTATFNYGATGLVLDDVGAADALGDAITGDVQIIYKDGDPTEISRLTLNGAGIDVLADATILGPENGLRTQSNIAMSVTNLGRFSTLTGQELGGGAALTLISTISPLDGFFEVLLNGETNNLEVGIDEVDAIIAGKGDISLLAERDTAGTRLRGLRIAADGGEITANANLTSNGLDAKFDVALNDVDLVIDGVNGPARIGGSMTQTNGEAPIRFDISGTGPSAQINATGAVLDENINAQIALNASNLATYAPLVGDAYTGAVEVDLSVAGAIDASNFALSIDGQTRDLQVGIAELDPLLRGAGTVSADINRTGEDQFAVNTLNVRTDHATINGAGRGGLNGPANANVDLRIANVGLVVPDLSGPLSANVTAARDAVGAMDVVLAARAPGATVNVDANIANAAGNNRVTGNAQAVIANLQPYQDLIGQPVSGGIDADVSGTLLPDLSLFDADITLLTQNLAIRNDTVDPLLRGAGALSAKLSRTGEDDFTVETLNLQTDQITINGVGSGGLNSPTDANVDLRIADIGLLAAGLNGPFSANIDANRDGDGAMKIVLDANGPGTDISVDATVANAAGNNRIAGNAKATIANLRPYQDLIGQPVSGGIDAVVVGTLLPDLSQFNTEITLRTQDIAIANPSVDQLLRGTGSVNANVARNENGLNVRNLQASTNNVSLSGSLNATDTGGTGQFEARLRDIGLFTDQLSGPVTASGTASRSGTSWGVDVSANGPGGIGAQVNGTVADSGNLSLRVNGNAPLGLANEIIAPRRLSGDATFALNVNGPPQLSSVGGRVNVVNGRLAAPTVNQALENINGSVSLGGNRADIAITGNVERGGQISVTGPVGIESPNNADIAIRLNDVVLKDPTLYESSIGGTVTVLGPLAGGARIGGLLELGPSEIQVPSSGLGTLGELPNVSHVGASAAVRQTLNRADVGTSQGSSGQRSSSASGPSYPLDLTINAPSRIFIRGRGLDAELGGTLNLGGTTNNIVPVGQFELIRGRLDILQQRFDLSEGTVSLQGDFEPFIRLVATTEARTGTVINIIVEGPASEPEVTFTSVPDLPQDEVLAQLIFGRDLSEISPLQAVQLAAAVSTLAGRGGGGLVDDFRQDIGLDDFDVTTDADGNAAVRAGAYLSENVYTDVTVSSDGSTEVNLNLDITDEITAKGTVDDDGETSIGIFFERDY